MRIFRHSVLLFLGTCCFTQYLAAALGPLHALHYCKKPLAYSLELLKKISLSHPKEAALTTLCLTAGCVQWWMTHKDSLFMEAGKELGSKLPSFIRI